MCGGLNFKWRGHVRGAMFELNPQHPSPTDNTNPSPNVFQRREVFK